MIKKLLIVFLLFTCFAKAQLIIDNTLTPAQLVQNVLVGQGVTPFNIKFNRSFPAATAVRDQAAKFSTNFNPSGLGLDSGILLTTGKSTVALGPNGAGNSSDATLIPVTGESDLATLTGQTIQNSSILEFDFVATGLVLNFDYVFASEEYPEWTSSIFNDVFGFFLSGPGITGTFTGGTAANIAVIPATTTGSYAVSIGNVNNGVGNAGPCRNCAYYVNNTVTTNPSYTYIQYDGFTVPLRATAPLICGETYHIKLAIANVSDSAWDSGVFIKNFRIEPLVLVDNLGLDNNTSVCFGQTVTISSGVTPSANILKWYKDGGLLPLETGPDLTITEAGVYTFEEYTPSGCRLAVDDITIGFLPEITATPPLDLTLCTSSAGPYQFNIDQRTLMTSTLNAGDYIITYYNTNASNEPYDGSPNGIIPEADLATYSITGTNATIWVRFEEISTGCVLVKTFDLNVVPTPTGTVSFSASPYCNNINTPQAITETSLTPGGVYSVTPAGLTIDAATGAITPFGSTVATYTVKYEIAASSTCPLFSTTTTVEVEACSCTVIASSSLETPCVNTAMTPITFTTSAGITGIVLTSGTLPVGISGSLSAGVFTLSGTPTSSGSQTFTYQVTSGGIDVCFVTTTIDVLPLPNAGVDGSAVVCNSSVTPIDLNLLITLEQSGGTWTRLTGTGGTFNASAGTFIPAGATTSTFRYLITGVAPCVDDFSVATVTINAQPNAGTDGGFTICNTDGTLINLSTLISGEQTGGVWTRTGTGTGGVFDAIAGTFTPTPTTTTSTFEYTLPGTFPCVNDFSIATVTINNQPNAGADGSITVCDDSLAPIGLFGLLTGAQTGGVWTRTGTGTGGVFDPLAGTFTPAAGATTSSFAYTLTGVGPCVNDSSEVIVNINPQPNAGLDGGVSICNTDGTLIDLSTLISGEQIGGVWTRTGTGSGGVFDPIAGTFTPTPTTTTSTFAYTLVGTAPCVTDFSIATITINNQPNAGADGAITICDDSTAPISLFGLITGEQSGGVWTRTGGSGGVFNAGAGTFTPASGASSSVFEYRIAGTFPCVDDFSLVNVTINAQPDAGTIGSSTVCDSSTALIDLNTIISGQQPGGTWTQLTGSGGLFDPILGTFTPASGAINSTFQYELVGVAPCVNARSVATVNINAQPNAGTSAGVTICETDTTLIDLNTIISGQQPGGVWTRTAGLGGTFNAAVGTYRSAIGATTSTFEYRLPGVAPCVDATSVATVTINRQPNAGVANAPLLVCSDSTALINLFDLITGEQSGGVWTRIGTGGIFDPIAGTFIPSPGGSSSLFTYYIAATPPCLDSSSQVSIVVIAAPNAGVDGVTTICDSSTTPIVLSTLITGEQPGGVWTRTGSGTGGNFDALSGTFTPASGAITSTFTYTVNGVAPCANDTSTVTININAQPFAGVDGLPKEVCDNDTTFIDLFSLINGEQAGGTWVRSTGTGGIFDPTAARYTPAPGATSSTFTYTITGVAPCVNSSSLATININPQPNAGVDGVVAVCDSSTTAIDLFSLITAEQSGGVWTRTAGTGGVFDATLGTFTPGVGATSSTFSYTLLGILPCSNDSSIATVNISPQPNAGVDGVTSICDSSATAIDLFGLITAEQAGGTWSRTSGTGGLFNAASGSFTPSAGATTSSFTYTIPGVFPCVNDSSVALVNINNQPNAGVDGAPQIVCESATTTIDLYSLIIGEQPGGTWTRSSGTGGIFNAIAGTFVPSVGATSSTFTYTLLGTAPCVNDSSLASVTILPTASIALTSGVSTQTLCINNNITPFSYTIGNGAFGASITSGDLPLGVNPIFTAGVLTISGTALESGTFPFVVTTTGGCSFSSLSGVLVVSPDVRLIPTSPTSTTFQSACINELIDPITYRTENNPTSVSVTGLPPGITGVYAGGILTISGSSSVVATYPYVLTTVGGCGVDSLNGTITINPDVTITLVSPTQTASQTVCINNPILPITYLLGNGATGASLVAGTVPEGIQGSYNSITKTFTINGVTRESGTFTYIIRTLGGCGTASLTGTINVNPLPVINLPQDGYICVDPSGNPISDYTLTTNLSTSQYSFEWSDINGVIVGETGNSYLATVPGPYSVKVTNLTTNCYDIQNATIVPSLAPSSATTTQTTYFEDNQEVVVSVQPPGEYLYQLDSGPFQANNYFLTFISGEHTITVKDKFGCGTAQTTFRIVNFPKFFTPNEDGYNDTWNIFEIADQTEAYIYIFDRFGKLIKQISTQGEGWDGKYNGAALPGDDYWFKVFYKENGQDKEFRSHFALKR